MRHNRIIDTIILKPLSVIYGWVVALRNSLFDWKMLPQHKFDVPVIVVGNLAVGGTGKTPHTEYVVNLLRRDYRIGVLSRGYKRRTKGFVMAHRRSTPNDIGDEPYQIYQKFGMDVRVAVCESRVKGINELLRLDPEINLIVLDDAFQHRYVKPTTSIVLTEWNHPVYNDDLLPLGRLRESIRGLLRADMVVITKCPSEIRPMEIRLIYDHLNLFPYQALYFSHYRYGKLVSVFPDEVRYMPDLRWLSNKDSVLVVSGIANPKPLVRHIKAHHVGMRVLRYPDHHDFTRHDFEEMQQAFESLGGQRKYIITTEKDAVRMANNPYFPHKLKPATFYIPIDVHFLDARMPQSMPSFDQHLRHTIEERTSANDGTPG